MDVHATLETLKIRKYPNRRYYDATRSKHVTLDDLHQLVRAGHRIEVTDPDGRDITNVVLTQILLEHDPPKLDLFPASLLHQALQANQEMVRRFIDEYFSKAMDQFLNSRKQFDGFLAQSGLSPLQPLTPFDWAKKFLQGFDRLPGAASAGEGLSTPAASPAVPNPDIDGLRTELAALKAELAGFSKRHARPAVRRTKSPTKLGKSARRRP